MSTTAPPPVFLGYQARWAADPSPVAVAEKSRRVGLSWAESAVCVLDAARAKGGRDTWCVSATHDMSMEFTRDAAMFARHFGVVCSEIRELSVDENCDEVVIPDEKSIKAARITFASGKRITSLASRPAGLRGKAGRVILDEAAFTPDLKGLVKSAIALLMWNGCVRIISTHNGDTNAFAELINDARAGKRPYSVHRITLQHALADGLYKRICLVNGVPWSPDAEAQWEADLRANYGDSAAEELDCVPSTGGGAYLDGATLRRAMRADIPVLRLTLPPAFAMRPDDERAAVVRDWCDEHLAPLLATLPRNARHYLGEDFGRVSDLTVLAPLTEQQNLTLRAPFLVELRCVPFSEQCAIVFYLCDRLPRFTHADFDATGNGAYIAERAAQRFGESRVSQVKLSDSYYLTASPKLKRAFDDGLLLIPQDTDVLQDLKALKLVKGIAKLADDAHRKATCDGSPRHGDAAIALLLGVNAALSDRGPAAGSTHDVAPQHYWAPRRRLM